MTLELTGEQLKITESRLKRHFPRSLQVYGVRADPIKVLVDRWPDFSVIVFKPVCEQKGDLFKDTVVYATDEAILEETIRKTPVIDWSRYLCFGKTMPCCSFRGFLIIEHGNSLTFYSLLSTWLLQSGLMIIDSSLFCISSGISLSSLDESHIGVVNQTWKFAESDGSVRMIRNMLASYPSCCVLDADAKPVAWILTYMSCAMGMLYTLPEHRQKGYAKILISAMAKRLHAQGSPVYCFIEEENVVSYKLFKNMGFTEDPSYRAAWFSVNEL
uniref:Glycine N-acyltransferase-like protein n=1 Tax=Sparus aurata TaxID=8175 RepID=A0A671YPE9_SPAAU